MDNIVFNILLMIIGFIYLIIGWKTKGCFDKVLGTFFLIFEDGLGIALFFIDLNDINKLIPGGFIDFLLTGTGEWSVFLVFASIPAVAWLIIKLIWWLFFSPNSPL